MTSHSRNVMHSGMVRTPHVHLASAEPEQVLHVLVEVMAAERTSVHTGFQATGGLRPRSTIITKA